ncbi:MAG TPA: energy-coupling factor transporter ATPase [Acholeplasma sp.]|jgi:energy-coupling factor transport system ATP-binding protein|nr:energy-coupling factor transporter ATPase [Acholeplasmatales bacterium]HHV33704.1 energy-coupling factor transporter ATPase [Acholeplasma sp.]
MGILFKDVSYAYKGVKDDRFEAINGINLKIKDGEFVAIIGKTGSGKSTLVQHMNALLQPSKGTVEIYGNILPKKRKQKIGPIRKHVGLVFQFPEYQLFEYTVLKDIMFGPKNFGLKEEEAEKKAREAAKLVGLGDEILERSPFRISGGQMRRTAIAGILAMEPHVLVLDEPTRGLDPQGAKEVMELFNKIHEEYNKTIVLVSHDMNIVSKYAKRIIVLKDGKIVFDGNREELFLSSNFKDFSLEKPLALELMEYLSETLNIPFKPLFNEEDIISYLKELDL